LLGQVALQGSWHDDRQVGLQQEVVDGFGQHLLHRRGGRVRRVAREHLARRRSERATTHHTERVRLGQ
jgi:hypothetical protein